MQQTEQLLTAIEQYLAGKATAAQRQLVNDWYHSFDDERITVQTEDADYERLLDARLRIRIAESTGTLVSNPEEVKTVRLWPKIAVVASRSKFGTSLIATAAAVAAIVVGVWFFNSDTGVSEVNSGLNLAVKNDIAPGKNGATITLANGKVIKLSEAKSGVVIGKDDLKYSDGAAIQGGGPDLYRSSTAQADDMMQLTASTAKGQTYQFTLPDGTKVWLNADSKISFPSQFSGKERRILLDGEGYFEVSKDKKHPFVVESKGQFLEVLGTHFNLNAYKDEPQIATTLLEGSVKVSVNGRALLIRPGQQAVNYGGKLQVNEVSLDDITDWKEGDFFLNHVDFKTAMRKIARWYDVEIVYDVAVPDDLESGGWMSRHNNLSTVLKAIEGTGLARFRIDGKTVHVFK